MDAGDALWSVLDASDGTPVGAIPAFPATELLPRLGEAELEGDGNDIVSGWAAWRVIRVVESTGGSSHDPSNNRDMLPPRTINSSRLVFLVTTFDSRPLGGAIPYLLPASA